VKRRHLGFCAHPRWTAVVAVPGSPGKPVVLERRRIETADTAIPDFKWPYYAAEWLGVEKWHVLPIRQLERVG
jgi:hypothetical protein